MLCEIRDCPIFATRNTKRLKGKKEQKSSPGEAEAKVVVAVVGVVVVAVGDPTVVGVVVPTAAPYDAMGAVLPPPNPDGPPTNPAPMAGAAHGCQTS